MKKSDSPSTREQKAQRITEVALFLQHNFMALTNEIVTKHGLSVPQFYLLIFLLRGEEYNMNTLASLMKHTMPATTGLVDRLVKNGLVERSITPLDRRQVLVKITPKGNELIDELKAEVTEVLGEVTKKISTEDLDAWVRVYDSAYEHFLETKYIESRKRF